MRPVLILLSIEFLDELAFGGRECSWPLLRQDLDLDYIEIGLLLAVPTIFGNLVEPVFGLLAEVWNRKFLMLGGGLAFGLSMLMVAFSWNFASLLLALAIASPASGVFVNLAQAALVEAEPERRERQMALWALSGSGANALAPILLGAALTLGVGWRALFVGFGVLTACVVLSMRHIEVPAPAAPAGALKGAARDAFQCLKEPDILRWLTLLECADLMLDVLYGYLALYCVEVVGVTPAQAAAAVAVWTLAGLSGDALLVPLLGRVDGIDYLRASAFANLLIFPAFLLFQEFEIKLGLLALLGLLNAGWYSILKARLYAALPGRSGTVMALGSVSNLAGGLLPLVVGLVAESAGLDLAMWLLLAAPVALLAWLKK